MVDFASLEMRIDSSEVETGVAKLDALTAAGGKTESAVGRLDTTMQGASRSTKTASAAADDYASKAQATANAANRLTASAGQQRAGMQQLSFQIGDVSQQFALGVSPMTIFAQQGGQVVQALGMMKGGATGLIGFLAGPWGAVLTGAVILLGSFFNSTNDATAAVDALREAEKRLADSKVALLDARYELGQALGQNVISYVDVKRAALDAGLAELASAQAALSASRIRMNAAKKEAIFMASSAATGTSAGYAIAGLGQLFGYGDTATANKDVTDRAADVNEEAAAVTKATSALYKAMQGSNNVSSGATRGNYSSSRASQSIARVQGLTDEQRAAEAATKASQSYITSLQDETAKIGKNAVELKRMEIDAKILAATTDVLKAATARAGLQFELTAKIQADADFQKNIIKPLENELALLGLIGPARDAAALALEREAFVAQYGADKWEKYAAAKMKLIDADKATADKLAADEAATAQLEAYLSMLDEAAAITDKAAQGMADAFGRVGDAIGRLASKFASYTADREASQQRINKLEKEPIKDMAAIAGARAAQKAMDLDYYRNVASGAKAFFKEGSDGYKALAAAEKALAVIQLVNTARSVAAGAAKMFATLGPFAFPAVAAMLAVMAGLGFAGGSGGASARIPSAEELQEAAGTGSVLGDGKAKSSSISRSLEIMSRNSNRDLEYSNQMVRSLRAIETGIGSLASALAKELSLPGGAFDTSNFGLGTKRGVSGIGFGALGTPVLKLLSQIPVIGGIVNTLFGTKTTRTLTDQGLNFSPQTIAAIMNGGFTGSTYSDIETTKKKKLFGISTGTKTSTDTITGDLDNGLERQVGLLIGSLRSGIVKAAGILGIEGAGAALDAFTVNIGKISLKDLTGTEIQEQLEAVFSKLGDDMAAAAIPGIDAFQKVGEGLFETLARLAKDYVTIDTALKSVGMTFGAVGASSVSAREGLIDLFGSLDDFVEQTSFFRDNFLTEAERIAPIASALRDELARLGLSGITTKDQFKAAVLGIDLTSEAGRSLYASLLNIAPAFSTVSDYVTGLNNTMRDSFSETVKQFTAYADSLRKYRDTLFQSESGTANAYVIARARFANVAGLAAAGNGDALGQLEGVSRTFLERSRENATSFQQYQRDMAAVANAVDAGIFAAESTADYAQLQLDALTNVVGLLSNIDTNIATLVSPPAPAVLTSNGVVTVGGDSANTALLDEIRLLREENKALTLKVVENSGATLRIWERMEGDGLAVRGVEGGDTPLQVQVTA